MSDLPPAETKATNSPPEPIAYFIGGAFVDILDQLGVSLAISTRPNHVILTGAVDGQINVTASAVSQPMGLAVNAKAIAVATARTIMVFANVPRLAAHYPGRKDYYDAFFVPRTIHMTGDCHMHDMTFAPGGIIGANTNFSCICRIDGGFSFTPLWTPPFITQLRAEDRCHLNGFASENHELRYLTALSATDTPGGWRAAPDDEGVLLDAVRNVILRADLCMPHSPRLFDGELYVLNGGEGQVLKIDRETGQSQVLTQLPGFTHGLCEHGGVLFVGLSQNRVSRKNSPPPVAQKNETLIAGIAALDRQSGKLLGVLEFTSGVTEVYDVQILVGIRRAGIQNILSTDNYVGIDTPNSAFWLRRPENDIQHFGEVSATGHYQVGVSRAIMPENGA